MKGLLVIFYGLMCSFSVYALSGQAYMDRFNTFTQWYEQLPINPSPEFIEFIKGPQPLSKKLREKWLYELARKKDWVNYNALFESTNDINLLCYAQIAKFNLGLQKEALKESAPIWLYGDTRPKSCDTLFDLLLKNENFDQNLIAQRIDLALERRNIQLARYLMKQLKIPLPAAADTLTKIYFNPTSVATLPKAPMHDRIALYALKRLVSMNMDKALLLWEQVKAKGLLSEAQQQAFISHVALYKAMRNADDAPQWFAKIKPQYYNDVLMDWEIRLALKQQDWKKVANLINHASNKDTPCWQYWLARSLEKQGQKEEAKAIYETLAKTRQYYGFLASIRLNKSPSFDNENPMTNLSKLKPYQPIIDKVKTLYYAKQEAQASRLLNDFISELPKDEASALVYWVDSVLQWHGKSVHLSNNEVLNNQLTLRFPLAYKDSVKQYSQKYAVPPEFVYAIIRQESAFRTDATSSVGALGLMQVMPRTASVVAKTDRIPFSNAKELYLSNKNINIGIAYLKQLGKRFSNHPVLIAASYNAGPRQVVYWLKNHPPREIDEWIETLPWQETRNYLKNVMAFYVVYQYRLNQKPNLTQFLEPLN